MKLISTPKQDGFWLPAEFEPKSEGFMIWPQRPDNWRDGGKPAQKMIVKLAEILVKYQPITMLVNESQYKNARSALPNQVRVLEMSSNDAFVKDTGPVYLKNHNNDIRCVDFNFNAWGGLLDGLYFPWDKDNEISRKLADLNGLDMYRSDFTLEGCSVVTDGQGTIITTEEVVLSEGRNKGVSKADAEKILETYLGAKKIIWLPEGFFLDEAGGDVDNMVNFIKPGEIVLSWTDNQNDPQYEISQKAFKILSTAKDAKGNTLIIHKMNLPKRMIELPQKQALGVDPINGMLPRTEGQRLTATYVNYITLEKVIIVPEFDDVNDQIAKQQLASYYPDREIIGFSANELLTGGGGLHTLVLNMPQH
jgi:agmatine deiminase